MNDTNPLDELARKLTALLPSGFKEGTEEIQQNFKAALQSGLSKMNLVTREEFDVQRSVLLKTREQLEQLEKKLATLEKTLNGHSNT